MKRGALQFSFSWLFAIIVGAIILFGAIYLSTKIIGSGETEISTKTAKQLGILLNPLESSFETATATSFSVPSVIRIYNRCDYGLETGYFGKQLISVATGNLKKGFSMGLNVSFANKYIFSEDPLEGKKFFLFSKPLEMPFKVADLIYLTSASKDYCFENLYADSDLYTEIESLNSSNPHLILENCPEESIKVCFGGGEDCDINVDGFNNAEGSQGSVEKNDESVNYVGDALMMAAIFSTKEVYECQLTRVVQRIKQLSLIYMEKEQLIKSTGCNSNLGQDLSNLARVSYKDSKDIFTISRMSDEIYKKNSEAMCKLW